MVRRLWAFVPGAAATLVLFVVMATRTMPDAARIIAIACIVFSLLTAALVAKPEVRGHAATALAIGAVTAIGQTKAGLPFAVASGLFAAVAVVALRRSREEAPIGHGRGAVVLGVVAAAVFAGLVVMLPLAGGVIERRINGWINTAISNGDGVGFSSRMRLGSTEGMLQSDRVVLRLHGKTEGIEYLRGAVYDDYQNREWTTTAVAKRVEPAKAEAPSLRLVFAQEAPIAHGAEARWFLPPNACNLRTHSGAISFDALGVAQPEPRDDVGEIGFDTSCPATATEAPRAQDLAIPPGLYVKIAPLAKAWTAGEATDAARVAALVRHLRAYGYSLDVRRNDRIDPIVDFLTQHREGHCELFASAVALLARSLRIPARVASGYRVTERSSLFAHAVVRERNAHAWTEVYTDGAWHLVDATPIVESMGRSSRWERASETTAFLWEALVAEATALRMFVLALLAGVVFFGRRWWLGRRKVKAVRLVAASEPLPCFVTLETSLARAGHPREPSEPVEHFAARLADLDRPWAERAAAAARQYAALRYGGLGDRGEVEASVEAAARAVAGAATEGATT